MHFLYSVINFLLLAAIIFVMFRKSIKKIFSSRREQISSQLDETEQLRAELAMLPPTTVESSPADDSEDQVSCVEQHHQIEKESERLKQDFEEQCINLRRETVISARNRVVEQLCDLAAKRFSEEPFLSNLRAREPEMVDKILERIKLTPGDISYLRNHDVLYVTLTSAYPLATELVDKIGYKTSKMLHEVGGKPSYWVKVDPTLIGGLRLRIGDTVYDCTVEDELYNLDKNLKRHSQVGSATAETLFSDFLSEINTMSLSVGEFQLGRVISVSDGICWLDGLADIMYGEVVEFQCGEQGMVLDIEPDKIGCVVFGKYEDIESGSRVRRIGKMASVPVGQALFGRIVDPLGEPLDGKGRIMATARRPIENTAPSIPDRKSVSVPLHTGIKAIDALVPIGRGQRELIIGDRQTGKTSVAIDAIINQKGKDVACIYVAIGQKETSVAEIVSKLQSVGAMEYTTVVCATASASASLQYIAPFAGAAMAEYFMYNGKDVLVVYDDLSKHAVAYRELSLLLHRPSGREAYPGDVFYLHARLLERAARLTESAGGGSVTALPIIETQAGDISAYIPTNVISITDGQIFLETDLFNEGQRPAVNVGLSVSRVGSAAQTKLMKQIASRLRMTLAQYRELATFAQFGSDVDDNTKSVLSSGERMMAALRQGRYCPLPDWQQALIIYAVSEGFASSVDPAEMESFESSLYSYFKKHQPRLVSLLKSGNKMSDETQTQLKEALTRFMEVR